MLLGPSTQPAADERRRDREHCYASTSLHVLMTRCHECLRVLRNG